MKSEGIDKLAQYLHEPISQDVDMNLIEYWSKMVDVRGMRDLAQMAIEILSIPAMSAEPERVFSGAKITLTDRGCTSAKKISLRYLHFSAPCIFWLRSVGQFF